MEGYLEAHSATPDKIIFLVWLRDKVPAGEYLMHWAIYGPTWCTLCKNATESTTHLFLKCTTMIELWKNISTGIIFLGTWDGDDIIRAWESWYHGHRGSKLQSLPIIISWYLRLARNQNIFDGKPASWSHTSPLIISAFNDMPEPPQPHIRWPLKIDKNVPWYFFDGAAQQQGCGGGFILYISEQHYYKVRMGLGIGSNNFAELISLRHLMHFSLNHNCVVIHIYGDSKIIVYWFNNITTCHTHTLINILDDIHNMKALFNDITCKHIYRKYNSSADELSKAATSLPRGEWLIQEQWGTNAFKYYHWPYIDPHYHRAESPWAEQQTNFWQSLYSFL